MTSGIIIQARYGSTRLHGKVLMKIGKDTVLEHVIDSCLSTDVDWVIVATTSSPQNTPIIETVKNHNRFNEGFHDRPLLDVYIYDGDEKNVIDRYYRCAKTFNLDTIVRITADCPLVQSSIINLCLKAFKYYEDTEYLSFLSVNGMDTEVFDFHAFERAYYFINKLNWNKKTQDDEKEHVTRFLRESGMFNTKRLEDIKLSIDTASDLEIARGICQSP